MRVYLMPHILWGLSLSLDGAETLASPVGVARIALPALFLVFFFACHGNSLLYMQIGTHSMTRGDPWLMDLLLCSSIISCILNLQILSTLTHIRFQMFLHKFVILPHAIGFTLLPCSLEAAPRHYAKANIELTLSVSSSSGISFLYYLWPNICKLLHYTFCIVLQLFKIAG